MRAQKVHIFIVCHCRILNIAFVALTEEDNEDKDKDTNYKPRHHAALEEMVQSFVLNSNGDEIMTTLKHKVSNHTLSRRLQSYFYH